MEGQDQKEGNSNESNPNLDQVKREFAQEIKNIKAENIGESVKIDSDKPPKPPFVCPPLILDWLQDLSPKVQKAILCKDLTPEQKKMAEPLFIPTEDERTINRKMMSWLVGKLVEKFPEAERYFSDELWFMLMNGGLFWNRVKGVNEIKEAYPANGVKQ